MSLKNDLIACLPPFEDKALKVVQKQGTDDIIDYILYVHAAYANDYDLIFEFFECPRVYDSAVDLWTFLKNNLVYNAETGKDQSVKGPSAILQDSSGVDCKHYSLFIGGVLDAISRNAQDSWSWAYAFASDTDPVYPTHVFVVIFDGKTQYWIDPCLSSFDKRKKYVYLKFEQPMALYVISGVDDGSGSVNNAGVIDVDKTVAWQSFLALLNMDYLGLKTLFLTYPAVVESPVKSYCMQMGYDYNQLQIFLNS